MSLADLTRTTSSRCLRQRTTLNRILFALIVLALALSPLAAGCSGSSSEAGTAEPATPTTPTTQVPTPTEGEEPDETTPPATQTEPQEPTIDSMVIEPASVELQIQGEQAFSATVLDSEGNPMPQAEVTWETADGLGTVNEEGILTAGTKAGTFEEGLTVTATANGRSVTATASVTLKPGTPVSVSIPDIQVPAAETHQLHFTATDEHGNEVTDPEATWTLTEVNAGTLTESGMLTAGEVARAFPDCVTVEIPVGDETLTAGGTVTIVAGPLAQVVVAPDPIELGIGMTQQFVAVGADRFGNRIPDLQFQWSVENEGGTIDESGLFTAGEEPDTYQDTVKVAAVQGEIEKSATATVTVEPDRIAFISDPDDEAFNVYIMDTDGESTETLISELPIASTLTWSPDGRRFALDIGGPWFGSIIAYNSEGKWGVSLTRTGYANFPDWSPDGKKIAYVARSDETETDEVFVMDVDGGNVTQITDTPDGDVFSPSWSPDGTKLVYDYTAEGEEGDIWVVNADGSNPKRLTSNPANETRPLYSPDGSQIVFMGNRNGNYDIFAMRADGSMLSNLTQGSLADDTDPSWSVDGSRIFFISARDSTEEDGRDIYVMNSSGGTATRLTTDDAFTIALRCAPRKRGLELSPDSVVLPNKSELARSMSPQEVIAAARGAVVKIETDLGVGSGFIIDPSGLIMTNNHVVVNAGSITAYLDDGTEYEATVRQREMVRDLAIIELVLDEEQGVIEFPYLELGDVGALDQGERVVVLGYPLGSETISITSGYVSAIEFDDGRAITWVKTDSAVNPGNSGGPLLNLHGEVVGVIAAKYVGIDVEGIGYAISANTAKAYLPELLEADDSDD